MSLQLLIAPTALLLRLIQGCQLVEKPSDNYLNDKPVKFVKLEVPKAEAIFNNTLEAMLQCPITLITSQKLQTSIAIIINLPIFYMALQFATQSLRLIHMIAQHSNLI